MFIEFLDALNNYSNLILIIVTAVYVILTWNMVREMRRAREAEVEPHLVAVLVPLGPLYVKLRVSNTGPGPAIDIQATISLEPSNGTEQRLWQHPALLSGAHEDFKLPGGEYSLDKLASRHKSLVVNLKWRNSFGRTQDGMYEIDLKEQKEGWYNSGMLVQPDDVPVQLGKIKDELAKIREHLDEMRLQRQMTDLMPEYERKKSPWRRLWHMLLNLARRS